MISNLQLDPMMPADLELLGRWLRRSHVSRWWGDAGESLAAVAQHPKMDQAFISVAGRPIGYLMWQSLDPASIAVAGLGDLPPDHVDLDIFIGEPGWLGRGVGPMALQLAVDLLRFRGVSSVGIGTDAANERALRAFHKAGFRPFRFFDEGGRAMCYLIREPVSAR